MSPHRGYILLIITAIAMLMLAGCTDDTAELKQKIAELEKKVQQQQKDLSEFTGKLALPKDFSADIQRIEDQQDRISQVLKTKVDPVNTKLEEFRDWAQEAQKDREVGRQETQGIGAVRRGSAKKSRCRQPRSGSDEQGSGRGQEERGRFFQGPGRSDQKHW